MGKRWRKFLLRVSHFAFGDKVALVLDGLELTCVAQADLDSWQSF